jgi:hypothetical protein
MAIMDQYLVKSIAVVYQVVLGIMNCLYNGMGPNVADMLQILRIVSLDLPGAQTLLLQAIVNAKRQGQDGLNKKRYIKNTITLSYGFNNP